LKLAAEGHVSRSGKPFQHMQIQRILVHLREKEKGAAWTAPHTGDQGSSAAPFCFLWSALTKGEIIVAVHKKKAPEGAP
jgi:hypothetical protein